MKNYQNKVNLFKWTKKKILKFFKDLVQGTVGICSKELEVHRAHSLRKLPVRYPDLAYGGQPAVNVLLGSLTFVHMVTFQRGPGSKNKRPDGQHWINKSSRRKTWAKKNPHELIIKKFFELHLFKVYWSWRRGWLCTFLKQSRNFLYVIDHQEGKLE